MKKNALSVVLAVFNEELVLEDCLKSVQDFADEIIIVDGGSTDRTIEIGKKYNAKVQVTDNPPIFHINKQKALELATGDWILQLDADERVTLELRKQIENVLNDEEINLTKNQDKLFKRHQQMIEKRDGAIGTQDGDVVAYFIPRLNYFLGGYLRHGGVYPDGVIRLVKKGKAHFPCQDVHEQMQVNGKVSWLSENLIHMGDPTFQRYIERSNRYTSLTATELSNSNIPRNLFSLLTYVVYKPFTTWFQLFIRHKGFLDGFPGFVFALFSGLHFSTAYLKYLESSHAQ